MEDRKIIELYNARDEKAIEYTQIKYGAYCHTVAMNILGSREDAEECVSDALLRLWNSIPPACPDSLRAFVSGIVRNCALSRWREGHRAKRGGGETAAALDELAEILPDNSENPAALADARALGQFINAFLMKLPERERQIFCARYYFMHPASEIARKLGVSKNYVWAVLSRTRSELKSNLEKAGWRI